MKFKAPGRKKKNKASNDAEQDTAAALQGEEVPGENIPAEDSSTKDQETLSPEQTAKENTEDDPVKTVVDESEVDLEEAPPIPEETPDTEDDVSATTPINGDLGDGDPSFEHQDSHEEEDINVELSPIKPIFGVLKKGPYYMFNSSPKSTKTTLRKQKWKEQFCRIDPSLSQIFCCDKEKGKLYELSAPIETDGKCSFFHFNVYTQVIEGVELEEDPKCKDFTFKITGLNGVSENHLTMSTSTPEEREKWCRVIRRSVNRMHIDQDRVGDHTKLRQMLTGQEAEISILEEELEKMAVIAGECSGRCALAEEKLALKEAEFSDTSTKLKMANLEIASLKAQLVIMEDRTKNLGMLADDVNGASAEEIEIAKRQMEEQRAARLKAIQLELGADEDYLEKYKKYLNAKRDSVLQKHGSQYSINSVGYCAKVSPSTANAPLSMN